MSKQRPTGQRRPPAPRETSAEAKGRISRQSVPRQPPAALGRTGPPAPRGLAARPRAIALVIAAIGFVLTEVNRETVRNERHFYPMLLLFGPACILFGIAGAIDPRVMNQSGIEAPRTANSFRAVMLGTVVAGMVLGWAMAHFWYKIW